MFWYLLPYCVLPSVMCVLAVEAAKSIHLAIWALGDTDELETQGRQWRGHLRDWCVWRRSAVWTESRWPWLLSPNPNQDGWQVWTLIVCCASLSNHRRKVCLHFLNFTIHWLHQSDCKMCCCVYVVNTCSAIWLVQPVDHESQILYRNGIQMKLDPPYVGGGAGMPDYHSYVKSGDTVVGCIHIIGP